MISLWNWAKKLFQNWINRLFQRAPWPVISFPTSGFETIEQSDLIEEETERSTLDQYYPVDIGDVYADRWQVVGKLGYGRFSTAWLARDLVARSFVSLKVYTNEKTNENEWDIYQELWQPSAHPGSMRVRGPLARFELLRPTGNHICIVHPPLWNSLKDVFMTLPDDGAISMQVIKSITLQLLCALDYMHTERKLVHTDIKPDNIMQLIYDDSILEKFVEAELQNPSARKTVGDKVIYASRHFEPPTYFRDAILCDFGSTVKGEETRNHDHQPIIFRSPESMLQVNWSYPTDIWNLGVMLWLLVENNLLFTCRHEKLDMFLTRSHLGEVIGLLGPPPNDLVQQGERSPEFFDKDGNWTVDDVEIKETTFEDMEKRLSGEDKEEFLSFMKCMITWRQEDRKTAKELMFHPWLREEILRCQAEASG